MENSERHYEFSRVIEWSLWWQYLSKRLNGKLREVCIIRKMETGCVCIRERNNYESQEKIPSFLLFSLCAPHQRRMLLLPFSWKLMFSDRPPWNDTSTNSWGAGYSRIMWKKRRNRQLEYRFQDAPSPQQSWYNALLSIHTYRRGWEPMLKVNLKQIQGFF